MERVTEARRRAEEAEDAGEEDDVGGVRRCRWRKCGTMDDIVDDDGDGDVVVMVMVMWW